MGSHTYSLLHDDILLEASNPREGSPGPSNHILPTRRALSPIDLLPSQARSPTPRRHARDLSPMYSSGRSTPLSQGGTSTRLASLENKFDTLSSDIHGLREVLLSNASDNRNYHRRQVAPLPPLRFKDAPVRVCNAGKTELQKTVRVAMNLCIGIKKDKSICEVEDLPAINIVDDYDDDPDHAAIKPTLDPMRPAFVRIHSEWNEKLWHLLETEMLQNLDYNSAMMKNAFFNRLTRLGRIIRESRQRTNETEAQFEDRTTGCIVEKRRRRQRAHTRRGTLFDTRKSITEWNRLDGDGNADEAWCVLDYAVSTLTSAGMSSDESDKDTKGNTVYSIKPTPWRSSYVTEMLRHVDNDLNKTNGFGNRWQGNAPRTRVWRPGSQPSGRQAPPRLPINFYDRHWYDDLSVRDRRELQAGDAVPLPAIDRARAR
ncbi:hypothetical protein APHAL10511_002805 [Amanita phalloides]|nr:hypothetical protein APHAL10511_002805 [Amanita phalloides]